MRRLPHLFLSLVLACYAAAGEAQTFMPLSQYGNITPSVGTFSMTKYGSLAPSLYTGAMFYSLPLYTYTDPDFTIPISLQYHYDGYKVAQHSGIVGLGWSLSAGGVITREIRGVPDEGNNDGSIKGWKVARDANIQYTAQNICSSTMVGYLVNVNTVPTYEEMIQNLTSFDAYHDSPMYATTGDYQYYDTAPDLFHFDFCGYSGDFMILDNGNVKAYNTNIPSGEFSISFIPPGESLTTEIVITMADGMEYRFGSSWEHLESAHSRPCESQSLMPVFGMGVAPGLQTSSANDITSTTITAFHLYQITAPNGRQVTFNRETGRLWELSFTADHVSKGNLGSMTQKLISNVCSSPLSSIKVDNKSIFTFTYENKTLNEDGAQYYLADEMNNTSYYQGLNYYGMDFRINPPKRLSAITVRNADGDQIDQINLTATYAQSGTPRMFLSSVSSLRFGKYSFSYNGTSQSFPAPDHLGYDHWGFWNGTDNTDVSLHLNTTNGAPSTDLYSQMSDSKKNANPDYAKRGALNKIIYPAGGETQIEYEGNTVSSRVQNNHSISACSPYTVGGIRVKRLIDLPDTNHADTTSFLYKSSMASNSTSGVLRQMPRHALNTQFTYESVYREELNNYTVNTPYMAYVNSTTYSNRGYFNSSRDNHVVYPNVIVVHPDHSYTLHSFTAIEDEIGSGASMGKHVFPNNDLATFTIISTTDIGEPILKDRKNQRGVPLSTKTYDAADHLLQNTTYSYQTEDITISTMLYNRPEQFTASYFVASNSHPNQITEIEYFYNTGGTSSGSTTRRQHFNYNNKNQRTKEWTEASGDTLSIYYRYIHETSGNNPSGLSLLVSDVAKTRSINGHHYLLEAEHYYYGISGNPHPTLITKYLPGSGLDVSGMSEVQMFAAAQSCPSFQFNFEYNQDNRLTKASSPGGAYISYEWDGNNIVSRRENGASNLQLYEWKDLVGLTEVTASSGQRESYEYDSGGRLYKTIDNDGHAVSVTHYHFKNNQ